MFFATGPARLPGDGARAPRGRRGGRCLPRRPAPAADEFADPGLPQLRVRVLLLGAGARRHRDAGAGLRCRAGVVVRRSGPAAGAYSSASPRSTQLRCSAARSTATVRAASSVLMSLAVIGCCAFASARHFCDAHAGPRADRRGAQRPPDGASDGLPAQVSARGAAAHEPWMLVAGSLGMVASTLPVQWLLPVLGWRGLFWRSRRCWPWRCWQIRLLVPTDAPARRGAPGEPGGYAAIWPPLVFRRRAAGFFHYGGMLAVQTLWAGPGWCGCAAGRRRAAAGLFAINVSMLLAFSPGAYRCRACTAMAGRRSGWCAGACRSARRARGWPAAGRACDGAAVGAVLRELLGGVAHPARGRPGHAAAQAGRTCRPQPC